MHLLYLNQRNDSNSTSSSKRISSYELVVSICLLLFLKNIPATSSSRRSITPTPGTKYKNDSLMPHMKFVEVIVTHLKTKTHLYAHLHRNKGQRCSPPSWLAGLSGHMATVSTICSIHTLVGNMSTQEFVWFSKIIQYFLCSISRQLWHDMANKWLTSRP